ncbi:MAG: hypothetical protein HUK12_08920, partial [Muribaculaceae bacterium]|nr:hypothetical protein [Muribaculaceae bacterium]
MIRNLLMIVAICLSFVANAQQIGTWKVHPIVGSNPNYLIASKDNVFYIVSNNLYCYDSGSEGIIHYNMQNYLSDSGVKNVYYNYDKKYLVVVYNNCNLDFITDEGKTYNFPDIRDVVITGETTAKSVNDVTFCPAANKAYIATSFGIVEIDDKKMEIRQSRRYYTSVNSVAQIGNYLVVSTAAGIYCDLASKPNMQLDAMATKFTGLTACTLYPINNNMFVAYKANTTHKCTIADDGTISSASIKGNTPDNCQKMSDGTILIPYAAQKVHIKITADGTSTQVNTPTAIGTEKFASYDGTYWTFSTTKGLRQLDTDGSTTLHDYIAVNGTTLTKIKAMGWHPLQNKLYISSMGPYNCNADGTYTTALNNYDGTTWTNIPWRTGVRTYFPVFDPVDPSVMYITSWNQGGIYKLVDGTLKLTIGSPVDGIIDNSARFDKSGNLWCFQQVEKTGQYAVCVLPRAKQSQETIEVSDWLKLDLNITINWGCYLYISPTTDYKFYSSNYNGLYVIWDNSNPTSSNIIVKNHKSFITQDGTSFNPSNSCILTMNE